LAVMKATTGYTIFTEIANTHTSGFVNMDTFATYWTASQLEYMTTLYSNIAAYSQGRAKSTPSDGENKRIMAALQPFLKPLAIPLQSGYGAFNPDNDFAHGPTICTASGWQHVCGQDAPTVRIRRTVQWLGDNEFDRRCESYVDKPTQHQPVGRFIGDGRIEVAPVNITEVLWKYYRNPNPIYVGRTTTNGRDFVDDNDPNNVDPEWNDPECRAIIMLCLEKAGVTLNDQLLMQYGLQKDGTIK
jgi:hypothetical protein